MTVAISPFYLFKFDLIVVIRFNIFSFNYRVDDDNDDDSLLLFFSPFFRFLFCLEQLLKTKRTSYTQVISAVSLTMMTFFSFVHYLLLAFFFFCVCVVARIWTVLRFNFIRFYLSYYKRLFVRITFVDAFERDIRHKSISIYCRYFSLKVLRFRSQMKKFITHISRSQHITAWYTMN